MNVQQMIIRMTPTTMVAMLGDLTEMGNLDQAECELISLVAYELIANVGEDAIMLLSEAGISHEMIDCEFAMWQDESEIEL